MDDEESVCGEVCNRVLNTDSTCWRGSAQMDALMKVGME